METSSVGEVGQQIPGAGVETGDLVELAQAKVDEMAGALLKALDEEPTPENIAAAAGLVKETIRKHKDVYAACVDMGNQVGVDGLRVYSAVSNRAIEYMEGLRGKSGLQGEEGVPNANWLPPHQG
ncbi:MAG: hypothetical protein WCT32_03875 [Patescibacteria group bacterium]|jgi:hypothetical protein